MAEFSNPFSGMVPERKMTKEELIRAVRISLAAEHEAVHLYTAQADATDDPVAKEVLRDVANEERVHAGEFMRLLQYLTGDEEQYLKEGAAEVEEEIAKLTGAAAAESVEAEAGQEIDDDGGTSPTIGSLK